MTRALIVALALSACVPRGRYIEASRELDVLREMAAEATTERDAAMTELRVARTDVARLETALSDERAALTEAVAEIEALGAEVAMLTPATAPKPTRPDDVGALRRALRARIDAGLIGVRPDAGGALVEISTDRLFASASDALSPDGRALLDDVAAALAALPTRDVQVIGHTDGRSPSGHPSNRHLAAARSIAVVSHLVAGGLLPEHLAVISWGEVRPIDTNRTEPGRARNRRIELRVLPLPR